MTEVFTSRVSYRGADRLDITAKSAGPVGRAFAPSWRILGPMITLRRSGGDEGAAWPQYVLDYTDEMRASYRLQRARWDALLSRDVVTLCCYCGNVERCHRRVLAEIAVKLGATYLGER